MPATYQEKELYNAWLRDRVITVARGDNTNVLEVDPEGKFWLGRLATESKVLLSNLGDRAERLYPCAIGFRIRLGAQVTQQISCGVSACCWHQPQETAAGDPQERWRKSERVSTQVVIDTPSRVGDSRRSGRNAIGQAFADAGFEGIEAEVRAEVEAGKQGPELVLTVVNVTDEDQLDRINPNLFEVELEAETGQPPDFELEALPQSFRYDRRMSAYGINAGVRMDGPGKFVTTDYVEAIVRRPVYWDEANCGQSPDLSYRTLSGDPIPSIHAFVTSLRSWGQTFWGETRLRQRATDEGWPSEMLDAALREASEFTNEILRIESGVRLLEQDTQLLRAFKLMNAAFDEGTKHDTWRAFQLGFVLASMPSIHPSTRESEADIVDTLWFSTGGGKTETYLGLLVTSALYDRLLGKREGMTGWARFPLRMLSLQQTQRFADTFAAAELVRQREDIEGECFSIGFFVGQSGTPNRVREDDPYAADPNDPEMPARYQVLLECPFCHSDEIRMEFDRTTWTLNHHCQNTTCPWDGPLPFRVVDEEIYRLLPTVVVGTLDKAASISMQAAMRAFYSAPYGKCSVPGHGFTYSPRSNARNGCRFPSCTAPVDQLSQARELYPPRIRIQDELHLLRDTLGAVSTHYEALLDQLLEDCDCKAKILASSATLGGYQHQVESLYRREGRLFPLPGPESGHSFWETDTDRIGRRYVALAPRGVTMEFATDRTNEAIQRAVRESIDSPQAVANEVGVVESSLPELVSIFGTQVTYGSSLRDVEAAARSFETEVQVDPIGAATLTGGTSLEDVRAILDRLDNPEPNFEDRIHLIAASSMLSHGVDVDRLNVMIMLGLPLSMAEFIQTSSRVGRAHPGIVFVMHKIGRERDAAVYRSFIPFIDHADRLVDPVPITRRSRRVLELTYPGLFLGRMLGLHEAAAVSQGIRPPTMFGTMRQAYQQLGITEDDELSALIQMLQIEGPLDEGMRRDLEEWTRQVFRALNDPATSAQWPSDIMPKGPPMLSLRDVEEQAPVFSRGGGRR